MIDSKLLRFDLELVATKLARRGMSLDTDFWLDVENKRKALQVKTEELQAAKNAGAKKIGEMKRSGENTDELLAQMENVSEQMKEAESKLKALQDEIFNKSLGIPNLPDDSVPMGADESDNVEIRRWGTPSL